MLQSVKQANGLTALMLLPSTKWSHEIAKQKTERMTCLVKAKTRQADRHDAGTKIQVKKRSVLRNIGKINGAIQSLDSAYSKLFNNFKNKKSK